MTTKTSDETVAQPAHEVALEYMPAYAWLIPGGALCQVMLSGTASFRLNLDSIGEVPQLDLDEVGYLEMHRSLLRSCAEWSSAYLTLLLGDVEAQERAYLPSSAFDGVAAAKSFHELLSATLETVRFESLDLCQSSAWVEFALIQRFQSVARVAAIYVGKYLDEKLVHVMVDMDSYDLELMEALFDREYEIKSRFPSVALSFSYLPLHGRNPAELAGESAVLIWERGAFVFRSIA
ncbi:MAG: hypothetical protein WBF66_09545 [Dehalococcoidia bacterium]